MKGKLSIGEDIKTLLKEIHLLVEDACCEAVIKRRSDPSFLADNAVNWGDLGCTDVQLFTDDGEYFNLVATVEEAENSAQELQAFIKDYLHERATISLSSLNGNSTTVDNKKPHFRGA